MSQKKLSEYIDALDGITYPQWVKLREGIDMQFDFFQKRAGKRYAGLFWRNGEIYPLTFWRGKR